MRPASFLKTPSAIAITGHLAHQCGQQVGGMLPAANATSVSAATIVGGRAPIPCHARCHVGLGARTADVFRVVFIAAVSGYFAHLGSSSLFMKFLPQQQIHL